MSNNFQVPGFFDSCCPAASPQLAVDILQMILDGACRQMELECNLIPLHTFCSKSEDFHFPDRQ